MPALADIYVEGFSSKFAWAGITPDIVRQVFIRLIEDKAMAHDEIIVARIDNHPAGMMIMQTHTEVPPPLPWLKAWNYASMAKSLYQRYGLSLMVQVATSRWPRKDNVYISSLSVATVYRNRGVAKAMLHYAISTGTSMGRKWIDLDVLPSNSIAIHVYNSCGFSMSRISELGFMARLSTGENKMNRMSRLLVNP